MTAIRPIRKQYYKRGKDGGKRRYTRVRYVVDFPEGFDISELVGRKLEFQRIDDEISVKPKWGCNAIAK